MYASAVSALPKVRAALLDLQKNMARRHNIVMDGRDIGTVVLPHADLKFFLTASAEERAKRRYEELVIKGSSVSYEDVLKDMKIRDANDSARDTAPLKAADDAILLDTTGNTLEQSVEMILKLIREKENVL
ncbi:Cytidylate kinase [bioreactor metagenome]|uniref:(d)CMP kinase n=1 Tax=bioreactor metagenome TaxID=1076179 RepID=A0A645DE00_9ZZZZ